MIPLTDNRMRAFGVTLALLHVAVGAARAQQAACPVPPDGDVDAGAAVRYLADDRLEGRLAGSPGERCAGEFIATRFRKIGLEPGGTGGTYFQSLPLASALDPHGAAGTGRNVIGILRAPTPAGSTAIVIGAHYDHLGRGGPGSLSPDQPGAIHNGADDNASGVAALIRAAERLAAEPPAATVVFVAFTGEESGLLGSAYFVDHSPIAASEMKAMLNMDMVGRLGAGPLIVYGLGTAAEWRSLLEPLSARMDLPMAFQQDGIGPSDHTSFYTRDVPVLHFFTNTHADYHRPSDDWERIDTAGLEKVAAAVAELTRTLASPALLLTLQRGAGVRNAGGGGFGAYLGSIPDFTPVERGVLLGGVGPGSPAEGAGLRKGDIIVGLGSHEVRDLQGLTDALRAHKPGDSVRVRFLRDGRENAVQLTLGSRSARE